MSTRFEHMSVDGCRRNRRGRGAVALMGVALCCALATAPAFASSPGPGTLDTMDDNGVVLEAESWEEPVVPDSAEPAAAGSEGPAEETPPSTSKPAEAAEPKQEDSASALLRQTGAWFALHDQAAVDRARSQVEAASAALAQAADDRTLAIVAFAVACAAAGIAALAAARMPQSARV